VGLPRYPDKHLHEEFLSPAVMREWRRARGILPELVGTKTRNDRGIGGEHVYMPRFNHRPGRKRDYLRGFGAQFWNTGASAGFDVNMQRSSWPHASTTTAR